MMSVSAVNRLTGGQPQTTVESAAMAGEDFLRLMLTQLQMQDPTEPLDNSELLQQFLAMTTIQSLQELSTSNNRIMYDSSKLLGMHFLGREVTVVTQDEEISGLVKGLRYDAGKVFLVIDGKEYALSDVVALLENR